MPPRITTDPEILGGAPTIRGTRLPLSVILGHLLSDDTDQEILATYPDLDPDDLAAIADDLRRVLGYASAMLRARAADDPNADPAKRRFFERGALILDALGRLAAEPVGAIVVGDVDTSGPADND